MTDSSLACIILAAGRSRRMKSSRSKVVHELAGRPLLSWVLETAQSLAPEKIIVVTGPDDDDVRALAAGHDTVIQPEPKGTGHAVQCALPALAGFKGTVLVLFGDGPLYTTQTLKSLDRTLNDGNDKAALAFLAMQPEDPTGYGRMLTDNGGYLTRIVEDKDATDAEKSIRLCWTGVMAARADRLGDWLAKIDNDNAAGEYYLTALPQIASEDGYHTVIGSSPVEETLGANTRAELAALERKIQERLRTKMLENGVTLIDPETVYFSWDTNIEQDVVIEPHVFFGPGVSVKTGTCIKAFSHIEGATISDNAVIGPHARLRPGAVIGSKSKIGNFVEIKNATLGEGVKANHHGYIGDAEIGDGTNFSCGAITVNYDGQTKHRTVIGKNAMIGSNVSLVAPITIGDDAFIGAGSTLRQDVKEGALAVERVKPTIIEGWATQRRTKKETK